MVHHAVIFSPVLGAWSDRFGRRPVILLSCLGLGWTTSHAVAPSLSWLFVGRSSPNHHIQHRHAFAYVTDVTPPEKRARPFGLISAAFGFGFVIGPLSVAGSAVTIFVFPFGSCGALPGNALYGYFVLRNHCRPSAAQPRLAMANPLARCGCFVHGPSFQVWPWSSRSTISRTVPGHRMGTLCGISLAWSRQDVGLSLAWSESARHCFWRSGSSFVKSLASATAPAA
jgi:MFS family permease